MRRSLGLYRRPSGIYAVRISIPQRLRIFIGKVEIHVSTGCRDSNSAIIAAHKIQLHWREHLMALDEQLLTSPSPILQDSGVIYLHQGAEVIGLDVSTLLVEFRNHNLPLYVAVEMLAGHEIEDIYDVERDYDGSFILNDVESRGVFRKYSGQLKLFDSRRSITALIEKQETKESTFIVGSGGGYFINDELIFTRDRVQVRKSDVEFIRIKLAKSVLPPPSVAVLPPSPAHSVPTPPAPISQDPITSKHGHKKFSELYEQYKKTKTWKLNVIQRMDNEAGLFIELMGDPSLISIDADMISRYAEALATLPSDIYLAKRRLKLATMRELVEIAAKEGMELKKPLTIKGHVSKLSEILNYGVRVNMLHFNPATEYKRGSTNRAFTKSQDAREIFTPVDLELIFSQSWFEKGAGKFTAKGATHWRPYYYWLPLLGLFSGARLNEISQTYLNDIKVFTDGTYFIDFNLEGVGKVNADDKSLKTVNSVRVVPIHQSLIDLGFINYVNALRETGEERLFPELRHDKLKGYGKDAGSWFNERFLGKTLKIERNGKKTFHSFRHTFLTAIERQNASESVMAQLAGHEKGSTESLKRYAKDRSAQELNPIINALSFDCIVQVKPFDISAGLKAIQVAKKVKNRNKRYKERS